MNLESYLGSSKGTPLSASLFSIVINNILKQLDLKGNISTQIKQSSAYADDILLTTRTMCAVEDTFQKLKEISIQIGLRLTGNNIPSIFNDESTGSFIYLRRHIYMSHVNKVQLIRVKMICVSAILVTRNVFNTIL
jgi:hypothetical protein